MNRLSWEFSVLHEAPPGIKFAANTRHNEKWNWFISSNLSKKYKRRWTKDIYLNRCTKVCTINHHLTGKTQKQKKKRHISICMHMSIYTYQWCHLVIINKHYCTYRHDNLLYVRFVKKSLIICLKRSGGSEIPAVLFHLSKYRRFIFAIGGDHFYFQFVEHFWFLYCIGRNCGPKCYFSKYDSDN